MKLFIAALLATAATSSHVECTNEPSEYCTGTCNAAPIAPKKGGSFTMKVNGNCKVSIAQPKFDLTATFNGLPILTKKGLDGCKANVIEMPLKLGSINIPKVPCPSPANQTLTLESIASIGKLAPNGKIKGNLVATDGTKTIFTLDFEGDFP